MHSVIDPVTGKSREVSYVLKLAKHVEVYIIGKRREWKDFWPLEDFIVSNPTFDEYVAVRK